MYVSVIGGGKGVDIVIKGKVLVVVVVVDFVIVVVILVIVASVDDVDVDDIDILMLAIVEQTIDIDPGCITALSFNLDCPELILGFEELLDKIIGL